MRTIFSSDIFERQRYGGISRYFVELAKKFSEMNLCEFQFATLIHVNSHLKDANLSKSLYLPFSPSRVRMEKVIGNANSCYSQLLTSRKTFQIRHETFYRNGVLNLDASRTVTTIYDLIRERENKDFIGKVEKTESINRADAIIAISQTTAKDIHQFYRVDPSIVRVIHLGVDEIFFEEAGRDGTPMRRSELIYVGERAGYKDFSTLIRAFAISIFLQKNFKVRVVGSPFTREELTLMCELKVQDSFVSHMANDLQLAELYRASVGLVVTSTYEGFGLPILESMASRCPVISTGGGSLKEIGGDHYIPFNAGDPESLALSIERATSLVFNTEFLTQAYQHAQQFSWSKTAKQTATLYQEVE